MFVVLLKSLINPSLNCALFFFPWCFPPELSQPIVTREEEKRDEQAERARKKKERGSGEVGTKERVEVAEMTTRLRVRE